MDWIGWEENTGEKKNTEMKGCAIKFGRWEEEKETEEAVWFATDVRRGKSDEKDQALCPIWEEAMGFVD